MGSAWVTDGDWLVPAGRFTNRLGARNSPRVRVCTRVCPCCARTRVHLRVCTCYVCARVRVRMFMCARVSVLCTCYVCTRVNVLCVCTCVSVCARVMFVVLRPSNI